jgi:hypothetical protein
LWSNGAIADEYLDACAQSLATRQEEITAGFATARMQPDFPSVVQIFWE